MKIRQATDDDRPAIAAFLEKRGHMPTIVIDGTVLDATKGEALIAGDYAGVLTFRMKDDGAEILTIDAEPPLAGVGSALLAFLVGVLRERGASALSVTTTNDNVNAMRFWQRRGFHLSAFRPGAMEAARRLKPTIPDVGRHGICVRDELVLTLDL